MCAYCQHVTRPWDAGADHPRPKDDAGSGLRKVGRPPLPFRGGQSGLFRFGLQIEADRTAGTAQGLGSWPARRSVDPGVAAFAAKAREEVLEGSDHRREILLPEIGPGVVVNGLVDRPLLDIHGAGRGGQHGPSLRCGVFLNVLPPGLGGVRRLAVEGVPISPASLSGGRAGAAHPPMACRTGGTPGRPQGRGPSR